ncbi:MAG: hypothetical protein ACI3ZS_05910 [Candidatus Cryptobacteroides sp.]
MEPVAEYQLSLGKDILGIDNPVYARIKQCADGSYLLMYQNGQIGSYIYAVKSVDLLNWDSPQILFEPEAVATPGGDDIRKFSSADAVVLSNGDILAVTSFRANKGYRYYPECNGIMIRRSEDNGNTWSDRQIIYQGTNWEPYILELPNGRLHCYFTDAEPNLKNSGTSLVYSDDRGITWEPSGVEQRCRVIRQYKYMNQGVKIFTDQMPCIRMLNDGHTLMGFMEARHESGSTVSGESSYWMNLVYTKDDWEILSEDQEGPSDRQSNLFEGAAGYVGQFRSGETLISCNINGFFSMKLGTCDGRRFYGTSWSSGWYQPFGGKGYWGSTEVTGSHEVLAAMHCSSAGTIQLGKFYLNHKIDAPRQKVKVDGSGDEWKSTQALFLGSASKEVSTAIRAANDGANLYILVDRSDKYLNAGDDIIVYLADGDAETVEGAVRISISLEGEVKYGKNDGVWKEAEIPDVKIATTVVGTPSDGRSDSGYVTEISVPLSLFRNKGANGMLVDVVVVDGTSQDTFTGANANTTARWMPIILK